MSALEGIRTWVGTLDRRVIWGAASAVVVLVGAYGGVATFMAGRVASHVTVGGVAIGGMSPMEANAALQRELTGKASTPVHPQCALWCR